MQDKPLLSSDYRIRKLIGTLGLLLPIVLPIIKGEFLASVSHYYYDRLTSQILIIILATFGLFLISYRGYVLDKSSEKISDDVLTNIGGFAALLIVFIPTSCTNSASTTIDFLCSNANQIPLPLFGHQSTTLNGIHFIAAGVFILCMGWMSRFKFTRDEHDPNNIIYKWCGNMVFISVGLIIIFVVLEKFTNIPIPLKNHYVYVFETTAIIPFGISWLLKGEAFEDIKTITKRVVKRET
ncbi:hypothetical protein [Tamlana crocina]|uniref:DUF998 domain-containing protein n=1 Tax=Tamlana crocina TaxID=393006 RepID=A0ABX1DAT7_9FLAO|nr:hypothetical protein [Tamlana crocina]NJX15473.1 hypothetical protein [Tamlana crocina]